MLTFPEVFIYSSKIGTARMADAVGIEGHREFLARLGLLDRMRTELPEVAHPTRAGDVAQDQLDYRPPSAKAFRPPPCRRPSVLPHC